MPDHPEAIEFLTVVDGQAIEGPKYPRDLGPVVYLDEEIADDTLADARFVAYPHKFYRRDRFGRPLPETLVEFLVPAELLVDGFPSDRALRAVAERMGWR
jgi:hypothetical protein